MVGYPYKYRDECQGIKIEEFSKILKIGSIAMIGVGFFSSFSANAVKSESLLEYAKKIKILEDDCNGRRNVISPVGTVFCSLSGWCMGKAKLKYKEGEFNQAVTLFCGGMRVLCGEQVIIYAGVSLS